MKLLLATLVLLAFGSTAEAAAPQGTPHGVLSPHSRYWLSADLNRLVFWQARAPAPMSAASTDAGSR